MLNHANAYTGFVDTIQTAPTPRAAVWYLEHDPMNVSGEGRIGAEDENEYPAWCGFPGKVAKTTDFAKNNCQYWIWQAANRHQGVLEYANGVDCA